jgi:hypothetical protein
VDKKAMLADLISQNGGTHSPSLTKFCTHLVSTDRTTQKYTFAMKHGIVCCSLDWLLESTGRVKWCRDATKYHVKDKEMSLVISTRADTCDAHPNDTDATAAAPCKACDEPTDDEACRHVDTTLANPPVCEQSGRQDDGRPGDAAQAAEANGLFLRDCGIWHVGLSPNELKELVSICCKSGATRLGFWHPTMVTHILRGSDPCTRADRECIVKALQSPVNPPHLVNMEWLRACSWSRREIDADDSCYRPREDWDGSVNPVQRIAERLDSGRSVQGLINQSNDGSNLSGGLRNDGIFSGYYFTLCAVRGSSEENVAEVLIRQHGGKINNSSVPSAGESKLLAICPPSLTRIEASRLRSQANNNFGSVAEENRFTLYWLKCCAKAKKMLAHQEGAPCFRPLPFELPMEGMCRVSISMSGYDEDIKWAIKHTVETIGGRVSVHNMSAKDTHLIVPHAHGEKYKHSHRLGVTAVTSQWLVESVKAGRLLPEARFKPLPKPGSERDAMVKGGNLGAVETTQHAWHVPKEADVRGSTAKQVPSPRRTTAALQRASKKAKAAQNIKAVYGSSKNDEESGRLDDAISDDLEKAGKQVTSLISRLQTAGARESSLPAGGMVAAKGPTARSSKRSSSRRIGLHQSENERQPDEQQQMHPFEMTEVSQRVWYGDER